MKRNRKIAVVAHCVLNQNTVLSEWARAKGSFKSVVKPVIDENLAIIQLPCPEVTYGTSGVSRPPKTYQDYDTPAFRQHCREMLYPSLRHIEALAQDGCTFELLMGIENSPCCDLRKGHGVLMEELFALLPPGVVIKKTEMVSESHVDEA